MLAARRSRFRGILDVMARRSGQPFFFVSLR